MRLVQLIILVIYFWILILPLIESRIRFVNIVGNVLYLPSSYVFQQKKGGVFKHRALKDALDILTMAHGNPFIFTYSSGFGALALQLKQIHDDFCSDWVSLDWGKREWPPIGTIAEGGFRGVKLGSEKVSSICSIVSCRNCDISYEDAYCIISLRKRTRQESAIVSWCNC